MGAMTAITVFLLSTVLFVHAAAQNFTYENDTNVIVQVEPNIPNILTVQQADTAPQDHTLNSFPGRMEILGNDWTTFDGNTEPIISKASVSCFEKTALTVSITFTKNFYGLVYPEGGWGTCDSLTFHGTGSPDAQVLLRAGYEDCSHVIRKFGSTFVNVRLRIQWDNLRVTAEDRVIDVTCDDPANGADPEYGLRMRLMDTVADKELSHTFPGREASLDLVLENANGRDVAVEWCVALDDNTGHLEVLRDNCPAPMLSPSPFGVPTTTTNGPSNKTLRFHFDTFGLPTADYVIMECSVNVCEGSCVTKRCEDDAGSLDGNGQVIRTVTLFRFYSLAVPTVNPQYTGDCSNTNVAVHCPQEAAAGTAAGFIGLGIALTIISYFVFMRCKTDVINAKLKDKEMEMKTYGFPVRNDMDHIPLQSIKRSVSEGSGDTLDDLKVNVH